jgi:serine phosphatase RsbU (regulator of sigma subunit)
MNFKRYVIIAVSLLSIVLAHADEKDRIAQTKRSLPGLKGEKLLAAYDSLLVLYFYEGDIENQIVYINHLIRLSKTLHEEKKAARYICERASIFYNADMNDSLIAVAKEDMEYLRESRQWNQYYEVWTHLVNTYAYSGKTGEGLKEVDEMYRDAESRHDQYGIGLAYYAMGNVYNNMHNWEESEENYQKSIEVLSKIQPIPHLLPDIFSYYGDVLEEQHKYDVLKQHTIHWKSFLRHYFAEAKKNKVYKEDDETLWAYYYLGCCQASLGLGNLNEAERQLDQVRKRIQSPDDYVSMCWLYYSAQLNLLKGRYQEALELNDQRTQYMQDTDDIFMDIKVRQQRAEILTRLGRDAEAAKLYREMYTINDSINTHETKRQLTEMNTRYHVNELKVKQQQDQIKIILIGASIIMLVLLGFILYRYRAAKRLKIAHDKLLVAYDQLEETTTAKERIESELRIARDIQMGMVPRQFPPFPERTDIDLYASMTPAKEVGGDLYDYFILHERLYFCVGDVSGKGVPASLFMAVACNLFRVIAQQEIPPCEIARQLNDALSADNENGMFVTMFIGVINLASGKMDFCNAGHNPPVIMNDGDAAHFLELEYNCCLGLFPGAEFDGGTIDDVREHPFFVYTDGLNEAENATQQQFGDNRLLSVLQSHSYENAQHTIDTLKEEVARHVAGADPSDDLTMLCVKINHPTA